MSRQERRLIEKARRRGPTTLHTLPDGSVSDDALDGVARVPDGIARPTTIGNPTARPGPMRRDWPPPWDPSMRPPPPKGAPPRKPAPRRDL